MVAAMAREVAPSGANRPPPVPSMTPFSSAQCTPSWYHAALSASAKAAIGQVASRGQAAARASS